jgi:peroxiredoxin (alkyl hydroperoxide reductase subunit C)
MAVEVGQPAPDFSLVDSEGQQVKLSDFRGQQNVALFFFPAAFTRVCELQVTGHDGAIGEFQKLNTQVLGVSTDQRFALKAWLQQCGAKSFPVLSDHLRRAVVDYGVARETGAGNERATFLIDKEGIVRWMQIEAQTRDWIGIDRELEELRKFAAAG